MKRKKILLIEDNVDITDVVRWVLEHEGYAVTTTKHVPALQLLPYEPDVILLDEWLLDSKGHMLCKDIKATQQTMHVPVIIFSTAPDIEQLVVNCSADGYIRKPFEMSELTREIRRVSQLFKIGS